MRYFTWEEPYEFEAFGKGPVHAKFTASEGWILTACTTFPEKRTYAEILQKFIADNYAWESDEHGKALPGCPKENPYVYSTHTDQVH